MSQARLVEIVKKSMGIQSEKVLEVLKATDRVLYVLANDKHYAYEDTPRSIGYSATISAMHMHAACLQYLIPVLKPGNKVLDIGCGSGYFTACLARMVSPNGKVIGIDHIPELVEFSRKNINSDDPALLTSGLIELLVGDGRLGYEPYAPYDAIHVGASAAQLPQALIDQLKIGGYLLIPEGKQNDSQYLNLYIKEANGKLTKSSLLGVRYVPLTSASHQLGNS